MKKINNAQKKKKNINWPTKAYISAIIYKCQE